MLWVSTGLSSTNLSSLDRIGLKDFAGKQAEVHVALRSVLLQYSEKS